MSKQEHTPSPWIIEEQTIGKESYAAYIEVSMQGGYRGPVAYVRSCQLENGITREEAVANARLIAAAPELLEALEAICEMQDRRYGDGTSTHMELAVLARAARAVIAKATGGEA